MADTFYSVVKGDGLSPGNVTTGAATSGEAIELRVLNGASITKTDLVQALKAIELFVVRGNELA